MMRFGVFFLARECAPGRDRVYEKIYLHHHALSDALLGDFVVGSL